MPDTFIIFASASVRGTHSTVVWRVPDTITFSILNGGKCNPGVANRCKKFMK